MKSIFNSLGSNYDTKMAFRTIFSCGDKSRELIEALKRKYNGDVILTNKGRQSFELALQSLGLDDYDGVAINGFTCLSVYQSIVKSRLKPILLDISKNELNFSAKTLEKELENGSKIKVVVIQNTLGFPADIEKIEEICKKYNIILIEDLAHCAGSFYANGSEVGTKGDFVVLSFGQDKILDSITGGALITRNKKYKISPKEFNKIPFIQQLKYRFYPFHALIIRNTYKLFFGKIYHKFLSQFNLLPRPVLENCADQAMLGWCCGLALDVIGKQKQNIEHRKMISNYYLNNLNKTVLLLNYSNLSRSNNLRFPILVKSRESLLNYLKNNNVYLSDIWYDAPIAPKKYQNKSGYRKGTCPIGEEVSDLIVNLPTHENIGKEYASKIAKLINDWSKDENAV